MDYKKAITGMINEIQSEKILRYICIIVADIYNDLRRYNRKEVINAESEHRDPVLLPHINPHMLRHTFCTRCAEAGLDIKVLQMIMGHSDISITMNIYNHVDAARVQNEMKKLENVM